MIRELSMAVLTRDIPELNLESGDVGTVVHVYEGGGAYEVEFVTAVGETVSVLTLTKADVRPMGLSSTTPP